MSEHIAFVTISVGAALLLLFWSTWSFVLTACHVLHCHRGVCRAILVILSANSSSPPALYSVLIISPLSCPHVCCLVSVHMLCSEAQFISLLIILADPVSFCLSCQSGAPVFAILPFRYMPASLGVWTALCLGVSLTVCPSLHGIPSYSSLLASGTPSGFAAAAY